MIDSAAAFKLFVPAQAVGASLVYFDLFNASGSGMTLEVDCVIPVVSGAVAVVGALGVDLFLTRTTAVGTGGTAATLNGTSLTAMTLSSVNGGAGALPATVTARLTPTGGATAGAVLNFCSLFSEETAAPTYNSGVQYDLVRRGMPDASAIIVPEGTGLRVVQGGVASVGNIGFDIFLRAKNK